jgi:hypothetical protein
MSDISDPLRAALGAGYVLEREAGAGGMAIVCQAHDVTLSEAKGDLPPMTTAPP